MRNAKRNTAYEPVGPQISGSRCCHHGECAEEGLYPAPKSRQDLRSYYWFCMAHIREYNRSWNYYEGMNESEIEAHIREDTVWRRPTWPIGTNGHTRHRFCPTGASDPFGFFPGNNSAGAHRSRNSQGEIPPPPAEEALVVFDLDPPVTVSTIKARYKKLAKQHHPDDTGGDKDSENLLKTINAAYTTLLSHYRP